MNDKVKNQINIGKMKKNNVVANGDTAIAIGKATKNVEKDSVWKILTSLIMSWIGK